MYYKYEYIYILYYLFKVIQLNLRKKKKEFGFPKKKGRIIFKKSFFILFYFYISKLEYEGFLKTPVFS